MSTATSLTQATEARDGATSGEAPATASRVLSYAVPSLVAAGGIGLLEYLRGRLQRSQVFLPDRYPNGVWNPAPYGVEAEDRWFEAEDGTGLHGWWIPRSRARATVIYCHGNTGSVAHQIGFLKALQWTKSSILAFDYRGYGRSEGSPSEKGLYGDVRAAYRHVVEDLDADPDTVILFGHSLGGAVAIDGALDLPVAGLVVQSSFTQIRDMARASFPSVPLHLLTRNQFRSIEKVGRLQVPTLFVHGDADGRVPLEQGRELFEAGAEPKELYVVEHAGHNDVYRHGGLGYVWKLRSFFKECAARDSRM